MNMKGRMQREAETVEAMIRYHCRIHHGSDQQNLCDECRQLLEYSRQRLANCPFQEGKTTCGKCPVHCYKPGMRDKIREVMRSVGPRMIVINPLMALQHAIDGLRKKPVKVKKGGR